MIAQNELLTISLRNRIGEILTLPIQTVTKDLLKNHFIEIDNDLHLSILKGEYHFSESVDALKVVVQNYFSDIENKFAVLLDAEDRLKIKTLRLNISYYFELNKNIEDNTKLLLEGKDGRLFDQRGLKSYEVLMEVTKMIEIEDKKKSQAFARSIFHINILLAYIDEQIECRDDIRNELRGIYNYLLNTKIEANNQNKKIISLLKSKADILLYKVNFRSYRSAKNNDEHFRKVPVLMEEDNAYYQFKKEIEYHYDQFSFDEYSKELKKAKEQDNTKVNSEKYNTALYHHINRFLKKEENVKSLPVKVRFDTLNELIKKLDIAATAADSSEVKICYKSIENLLKNTRLFWVLKEERSKEYSSIFKELKAYFSANSESKIASNTCQKYYQNAFTISEKNSLPNYYCFYCVSKFLTELIDYLIQCPEKIITKEIKELDTELIHKKINSLITFFQTEYTQNHYSLLESIETMATHQSRPVYLRFFESLCTNKEGDELYLSSSYVLPQNFSELKKEVIFAKGSVLARLNQLKDALEIEYGQIAINNSIEGFEKKVKENEFKIVQIIAMFVSIATFVLINVKIFDNKTGLESFGIILGLAACFFMFNLIFYFIIMGQYDGVSRGRNFIRWSIILTITPLLLGAASYCILHFEGRKKAADYEKINQQLHSDSINIHKILDNPLFYSTKDTIIIEAKAIPNKKGG